jgi:hypothetical protein
MIAPCDCRACQDGFASLRRGAKSPNAVACITRVMPVLFLTRVCVLEWRQPGAHDERAGVRRDLARCVATCVP